MRKRHLHNMVLVVGALGGPVPEAASEAVHGDVVAAHPLEQARHRHVRKRGALLPADEDVGVILSRQCPQDFERLIRQRDLVLFAAFDERPAGTVQVFASKSISSQVAPMLSPVLAAVKIVNSKARAAMPSRLARSAMNSGSSTNGSARGGDWTSGFGREPVEPRRGDPSNVPGFHLCDSCARWPNRAPTRCAGGHG